MNEQAPPEAVSNSEMLARYVLYARWIRADLTPKPDAFIPHPYPDLSVTRHAGLTEPAIWDIGRWIAQTRSLPLAGRADVLAGDVVAQDLAVVADPQPDNGNHANVTGWPPEKAAQKMKALELAKAARFLPAPGPER
jgi:hypothetical protein